MDGKLRKWQFVDDDGKIKDGWVEVDDQTWEELAGGVSEERRQRLFAHYDRVAKWRFHHPQKDEKE